MIYHCLDLLILTEMENRDLLVGDPSIAVSEGQTVDMYYGGVWVLLMNADGSVKDLDYFADGYNGFPTPEIAADSQFGRSVASMNYSQDGTSSPYLAVGWPSFFVDHGGPWETADGGFWMVETGVYR